MRNIELFNLAVGEILGYCYERFPRRIDVNAELISSRVCEYYEPELIDSEFRKESQEVSGATIVWLINAGYLWVGENHEYEFLDVTITPKSLELLNLIPSSIDGQSTIGSKLVHGAKASGKNAALSLMSTLLSEGVKLSLSPGI